MNRDIEITQRDVDAFLALNFERRLTFLLRFIRDNPRRWDQSLWVSVQDRCEHGFVVARCLGAWAVVFGTGELVPPVLDFPRRSPRWSANRLQEKAAELLGLDERLSYGLFFYTSGIRTPRALVRRAAEITGYQLELDVVDELVASG